MSLLDAYSFQEEALLQISGEVSEATMVDSHHMLLRSAKGILTYYARGFEDDPNDRDFQKQYEVRLEEGDCYWADLTHLVVFRKRAVIEVYAHTPQEIDPRLPSSELECYEELKAVHPHL